MRNSFSKYIKYIPPLIIIFELVYFGIPDFVKPIFVYEYFIFFGVSYLFAILQDFFNPSKKTDILLRVVMIICSLILLITSVYYTDTFSIIFSTIMFIAISFSLYLAIKSNKQQD
ncbi:ABC-type arginine transport system permease subunit [Lysinibacillus sp. RC46]|uniref:hypothetical protein n=1 Tax=unclassified Lysinibacillus TaxID=2636778 RepID=UPI0035132DDF